MDSHRKNLYDFFESCPRCFFLSLSYSSGRCPMCGHATKVRLLMMTEVRRRRIEAEKAKELADLKP